jgi:Leucine-rich repeat (LRR) protein
MGNDSSKSKPGASTSSKASNVLASLKPGPSTAVIQRHLDTAKKSRSLTLKGMNLKAIPRELGEVAPLLRSLDLSQNRITQLPLFFGQFELLKQLHLNGNALTSLTDELGNLKKLEILILSNNDLSMLPETLVGCTNLTTLKVDGNHLTTFPTCLCLIPRLDIVDLSMNQIESIPDEIGQINASEINLNNNRLSTLNPAIATARNLRVLRVESNALPKQAFFKELLEDSQLSLISVQNNSFQEKDFQDLPGYEKYEERFTALRRKGVY